MNHILAESTSASNSPWLWVAFAVLVLTVLSLDLGVFHRKAHRVGTREATAWVLVWTTLALLFNAGILIFQGSQSAVEFLTGYIVELSLSVDNIFVFVCVFAYFGVRPEHQHRVLFWGILGAVVMRLVFIFAAIELLDRVAVLVYVFGLFLIYTGVKFLFQEPEVHPEKNLFLRFARKNLPISKEFHGEHFFVREPIDASPEAAAAGPAREGMPSVLRKGRLVATPLFLVLIVVEASDVLFAVDSVPAILGITRDRFIAYTSNIFAILGLRSMYFLLASFLDTFHYLKYGLSLVLIFIGLKMLTHSIVPISPVVSLITVGILLAGSVALSLLLPRKETASGKHGEPGKSPADLPPPGPPANRTDPDGERGA
jgi:tellurite resistance protein TerC